MPLTGQFVLYGVIPSEHDDKNADLRQAAEMGEQGGQRIGGTIPLYATDDKQEALEVYRAGGFERNGQWLAVTWGKDTSTGGTIGAVPEPSDG